jgi:uncharacterized protein DUF6894
VPLAEGPTLMPKYFFHLLGDVPAHDLIGHECAGDKEAEKFAKLLARHVGTDRPDMVREGNYISVVDGRDRELFRVPLSSLSA